MIKNVKNTVLWTYIISGLNREKIVVTFFKEIAKKNFENEIKKNLELKK